MTTQQQRTNAKLIGLLGGLLITSAGALYLTGGLDVSAGGAKISVPDAKAPSPLAENTAQETAETAPKLTGFQATYAEYMAAGDPAILDPARFNGVTLPEGWRAVTDRNFGIGVPGEEIGDAVRPLKGLELELSYKEFGATEEVRERARQWLGYTALWYAGRDTRPEDGLARAHFFAPTGAIFDITLDPAADFEVPVTLDAHVLHFEPMEAELFGGMLELRASGLDVHDQ